MAAETLGLSPALLAWMRDNAGRETDVQSALRKETMALADVGHWAMPPEEGQFIGLLAKIVAASHILEVGTFTGYGTLWLALSCPSARIITCERFDEFAAIAQRHWQAAGVGDRIDLRIGDALATLDALVEADEDAFDLIVIDADKKPYPHYYARAKELIRPGGLILLDNAFRDGGVADLNDKSKATEAIRQVTLTVRDDPDVDMSLVPIADGLIVARMR